MHIVLLGDSLFDNAAYANGGPEVCTQLKRELSSLQRQAVTALSLFNDGIIREAFRAGLPLLDLRMICTDDADYANAIEPSSAGGAKIARSIVQAIREHDFSRGRTEVFTSATA